PPARGHITALPNMADSNHGLRNDVVGEPELAIEFKSSRRNHHGARVLAGSICFRNNAEAHAASHKTQGQVQAGWSRAHDQYRSSHYTLRTKLPNHWISVSRYALLRIEAPRHGRRDLTSSQD